MRTKCIITQKQIMFELKKTKIVKYLSLKKKLFSYVIGFIAYKNPDTSISDKAIYIDIKNIKQYARYIYLLVKFFNIEGYQVYLPKKYSIYKAIIHENLFIKILLKENLINFKALSNTQKIIVLNDNNLSPDYFNFLLQQSSKEHSYHIPMTMFPRMYQLNLWNLPVYDGKRKKSTFMIGNFDAIEYSQIREADFGVASRIKLYDMLFEQNILTSFDSYQELKKFIESEEDKKCIIIKSETFKINLENIRPLLGKFSFFIAFPGIVMPPCHNLIEALSVGTIPIIQKNYAATLQPPLIDNINSIQFENENDIIEKINWSYTLSDSKIDEMKTKAMEYYTHYLTPKSVVESIVSDPKRKFYLLAEQKSVEIFQQANFNTLQLENK